MRHDAGEAEGETKPLLLDLVARADVEQPKLHTTTEAEIKVLPAPGRPATVVALVVAVGGDGHLNTKLFFVGDLRL